MRKTIVASYSTLHAAEAVVDELVKNKFEREDIGLAISKQAPSPNSKAQLEQEGPALVTVTVNPERLDVARQIIQQQSPQEVDERDVQWRKDGATGDTPDEDTFTAVDRK